MKYVIGVDLGTSAVKVLLVSQSGEVVQSVTQSYTLSQPQPGFSEQDPQAWVDATQGAIKQLIAESAIAPAEIEALSYSGQMHGLVLMDQAGKVLRPAILWNDTRTTAQCREIEATMGQRFVEITRNRPLEGFTLPKLLWVKEHEPAVYAKAAHFLLPKDYLRYQMTGKLAMELSDAAGTAMLAIESSQWSAEIQQQFDLDSKLFPPLITATSNAGAISQATAAATGLKPTTQVFGGGADNACGAIGAGVLSADTGLSSIGTSGVVLSAEPSLTRDYHGRLHFFNHAVPNQYYAMGVTLAAGYSLSWLKQTLAKAQPFDEFVAQAANAPLGAHGLLYAPYLVGERTPYADANIRGSFIGVDARQQPADFVRAVMEGVTFSFKDILNLYAAQGRYFKRMVAIGGGAKSQLWLQIQADIFNLPVVSLTSEQGPGLGAAMVAAVGLDWFKDFETCARQFVHYNEPICPIPENVAQYAKLYQLYHEIYLATKKLSVKLAEFRSGTNHV